MGFVNRSGGDENEDADEADAGAAALYDVDFDPNDPNQTKVHYNLSGWGFEQRAELAETLAELSVPHIWDGEELVVPEEIEEAVDALFDRLEAEIGPFPIPLIDGDASTEFGLDEWPFGDIETLKESLIHAEIPHTWEGRTLLVAQDAEHVVDDLLDAIEAGEVASLDEDAVAPDGAMNDLYLAADGLARDVTNGKARNQLFALTPEISPTVPPFGISVHSWGVIVEHAHALVARFEETADPELIAEAADELRSVCRPFV
jgi:hypothetical protein